MSQYQNCPDESSLLPLREIRGMSTQYYTEFDGHEYCIQYKRGWISVERDPLDYEAVRLFSQQIGEYTIYDGIWSDEETTVYLTLTSDAIRQGRITELCVPTIEEAKAHPLYRRGLYPSYEVGILCGKTISVPACQVAQWITEHPEEHAALVRADKHKKKFFERFYRLE